MSDNKRFPSLRRQGTATQLVVEGKPFVMLAGELHNSSASGAEYLERVLAKAKKLNLNTVIAPVSWDQFEPKEGEFDATMVEALIERARAHALKLVILWFGSWKNGVSSYVPEWVLRDTARFPRVVSAVGEQRNILSPLSAAARDADAKAFTALMRKIRDRDSKGAVVVTVQVENEMGILYDVRDRSAVAEQAFQGAVPEELMRYLAEHEAELHPELLRRWKSAGALSGGTWSEVFGAYPGADEIFSVWHYATYTQAVAEAGKKMHPLPMYVNAWLATPGGAIGCYPTGGPVEFMLDVWKAGAPAIDFFSPDIYAEAFKEICAQYVRNDNPLMIPEANRDGDVAAQAYWALGHHHGLCYAPFGIENLPEDHPLGDAYALLRQLMPLMADAHGTDRMKGFYRQKNEMGNPPPFAMGAWTFHVRYIPGAERNGAPGLIIVQTDNDEFIVAGHGFSLAPVGVASPGKPNFGIASVEAGHYDRGGSFVCDLRLNGDETAHNALVQHPIPMLTAVGEADRPLLFRLRLYRF
ncbi:MAG: DUF5597 domain-containing protein [Kiritimatiellaeota bacterium]|nr:DUF5597 domain-containing protein [Kiritimatiellota bacterium]